MINLEDLELTELEELQQSVAQELDRRQKLEAIPAAVEELSRQYSKAGGDCEMIVKAVRLETETEIDD